MKRLNALFVALFVAVTLSATGQRESGDFTYDTVESLTVEAETFAVDIVAFRGRQIDVRVENYPDDWTVYHSANGGTIRVWVERDFSLVSRPHRGRLVIRIPADIPVSVETSTGSVDLRGTRGGDLRVETTTGSMEVDDVGGGGTLRSTTGSISIEECTGSFDVRSTTGSIRVDRLEGDLRTTSSTGEQRLSRIVGDIDARATTGGIEIEDTNGRLAVRTSTGSIVGDEVTLTVNSSFEATTGRIEIDVTNNLDELEFDLRSTTGSLQVGDERSQRRLFFGGTGITVTGSTSTGSQHYR